MIKQKIKFSNNLKNYCEEKQKKQIKNKIEKCF